MKQPKRGHFLNEEQKKIKQKIMEDLINSFINNLEPNQDKFDTQASQDIIFSCLIMFTSDILMGMIMQSEDIQGNVHSVIMQYQNAVYSRITERVDKFIKDLNEATH